MPYVQVAPGGRYFATEDGKPFLLIGQNVAMPWPDMWQMHYENDVPATENYIRMLAQSGVTLLRIMLEYCEDDYWYFENPAGNFLPEAVLYWDDLVGLCEKYQIRLLVVPWDTFFMHKRWNKHPYSKLDGGLEDISSFCTNPVAIEHEKGRM